MSRYIIDDKAVAQINDTLWDSGSDWQQAINIVSIYTPKEDVAPIIHAHLELCWKKDVFGNKYWAYQCSGCGAIFPIEESDGWKYCPKCGAKLDEATG